MHPALDSRSVEKICVFLSILKPSDSRFLSPISFFLLPALVYFSQESSFLFVIVLCPALNNDFLVKKIHLKLCLFLVVEDVSKLGFIPLFKRVLKIPELLLKLEHFLAIHRSKRVPSLSDKVFKTDMGEPK